MFYMIFHGEPGFYIYILVYHIVFENFLFYELHKNFLMTCRSLSFEYELVQEAGGNISYKFE